MSTEFKLPPIGENVKKAEIGNLRVAEGDVISADQVVMEIETDKAVFDLPCPNPGKVLKVHVKPGDSVTTGTTLLTLEETAAAGKPPADAPQPPKQETAAADKPPAAATQPAKPSRPPAAAAEPPAPPASAAPAPAPAPEPALAPSPVAAPSSSAVGADVVRAAVAAARSTPPPEAKQAALASRPPAPAGPATRRLARELGVDLHRLTGTGPGGRITSEDVHHYVRDRLGTLDDEKGTASEPKSQAPPLPDFAKFGPIEREKLNKVMRTAAANLSLAWNIIPHVTQHELADVTELEAARKRYAAGAAKEGGPKITMTVLAMKAVVTALKAFPRFNSSYDAAAGELILKRYYHIGIAVDTDQGLMVPVIRDVDTKSVVQLAGELVELALKSRDRKLLPAEMQGSSFTITNLGGIGGTSFTPIVNYPEVAILGMSRSSQQQVIVNGQSEIRLMLPLSLSYDHRVINGADAARFIVKLAGLLSDPFQLLSEV